MISKKLETGMPSDHPPLRIGISACLLGQKVRYDGDHKHKAFMVETLSQWAELIPVCPEVAIGLGVPREPIRLESDGKVVRALGVDSRIDVSERLQGYGREMARELAGLSGYVFKSRSPSCGMKQVSLYGPDGEIDQAGVGLYAAEIIRAMPELPMEEENRLCSLEQCERFMERVRAYRRWQDQQP